MVKNTNNKAAEKPSVGRRLARASLYMVPGYPIVVALRSARATVGSGAATIADLRTKLAKKKARPRRIRTYREAIANRSVDALPLKTIARDCVRRKRLALFFAYLGCIYLLVGLIEWRALTIFNAILAMALPAPFAVREEHRLWQMETGPKNPDAPLGSIGQFFKTRGVAWRLLNPYL